MSKYILDRSVKAGNKVTSTIIQVKDRGWLFQEAKVELGQQRFQKDETENEIERRDQKVETEKESGLGETIG